MKKLFILMVPVLILLSCEKDPGPGTDETAAITARDTLYYVMKEWYYWYDQMPEVSREDYDDPYDLLDAMRYRDLDRWSFVSDYDEFVAEMQGEFVGHGFRLGVDNTGRARIAMIYNNSPLSKLGVRRGWIVKSINGVDIAPILLNGSPAEYTDVIGPSRAGVTNTFVFTKPDGTDQTIKSAKATFTVNSVLLYDTLHLKTGVTGHLVFESFINPSRNELATAFAFFKANNVKDLVVDLRYNGGGYLDIAQTLASYIGGNNLAGQTFAELEYNDKHQDENTKYTFKTSSYSLGLRRVVFITTRSTASASEAVMNGLVPHLSVVSIGDTTNGKPTGMNGWEVAKKYFIWPVTFKIVNSAGQGEYFAGIAPAKIVEDDIKHDFNDRREANLWEAIRYLETGSLARSKRSAPVRNSPQLTEKPGWMNNTFVK